MPQLSLYLDEPTMDTLRHDAKRANTSLSRYVRDILHQHTAASAWPEGWFDLCGVIVDDDGLEEPEDVPFDLDRPVPAFD